MDAQDHSPTLLKGPIDYTRGIEASLEILWPTKLQEYHMIPSASLFWEAGQAGV